MFHQFKLMELLRRKTWTGRSLVRPVPCDCRGHYDHRHGLYLLTGQHGLADQSQSRACFLIIIFMSGNAGSCMNFAICMVSWRPGPPLQLSRGASALRQSTKARSGDPAGHGALVINSLFDMRQCNAFLPRILPKVYSQASTRSTII